MKRVASSKELAPKTLIYIHAILETERSVQFNLLPLETMHHGKCTLGNDASQPAQVVQ